MPSFEAFLQAVGYHFVKAQPFLPTYVHVVLTALVAIYTGAHASLFRPKSAAKPTKKKEQSDSDDDDDEESSETVQKMEGLSPSDAVMFPLLAGCTLAGLYFLIKWLKDPAILNLILNWYFAIFGVLSIARLFTDAMGVWTSFIFPAKYISDGKVWEINRKQRVVQSAAGPRFARASPLPGRLSKIPLPSSTIDILWTLRELPSRRAQIRAYIHRILEANLSLGPQGSFGFVLALMAVLYYNLIGKPWWLTNILGGSFAYTSLQFMSPSTTWTATLILCALFVYDIYFVFYTPMMVTVATKIDIPAKMLFPRPSDPGHPARSLAMLGLGDIVLPGIVIGFALRFDLYMFYLKKQRSQEREQGGTSEATSETSKIPYRTATGSWGERFWLSTSLFSPHSLSPVLGVTFPKPYFNASIIGYTAGLATTLGIMQIFGHAQPALLYLVPGVLIALWGTALVRGELKDIWDYDEGEEDEGNDKKKDEKDNKRDQQKEGKKSIFSWSRQDDISKRLQEAVGLKADGDGSGKPKRQTTDATTEPKDSKKEEEADTTVGSKASEEKGFFRGRTTELVFFSINLPELDMDKTTQGQNKNTDTADSNPTDLDKPLNGRQKTPARMTAYMFYASKNRTMLHDEGGAPLQFGQIGNELKRRWAALTPEQRAPYEEMERKERERLEGEEAAKLTDNDKDEEKVDEASPALVADLEKDDPKAPHRNLSPYIHWAGTRREQVRQENPRAAFVEVARILGEEWKAISREERERFERIAEEDRQRYEREKAEYDSANGKGR